MTSKYIFDQQFPCLMQLCDAIVNGILRIYEKTIFFSNQIKLFFKYLISVFSARALPAPAIN